MPNDFLAGPSLNVSNFNGWNICTEDEVEITRTFPPGDSFAVRSKVGSKSFVKEPCANGQHRLQGMSSGANPSVAHANK